MECIRHQYKLSFCKPGIHLRVSLCLDLWGTTFRLSSGFHLFILHVGSVWILSHWGCELHSRCWWGQSRSLVIRDGCHAKSWKPQQESCETWTTESFNIMV